MMLMQDGSTHRWIGALGRDIDLIVTMDDATSCDHRRFSPNRKARCRASEDCGRRLTAHGLFGSLYTDRGSHYFHTPVGGRQGGQEDLTQVGRAWSTGHPSHPSYTPRARGTDGTGVRHVATALAAGRCAEHGLTDDGDGECYLRETYVPTAQRAVLAKQAAEQGSACCLAGGHGAGRGALCAGGSARSGGTTA